jgi:putative Mg2+ transporter-C (MgtC) family protein
MILISIGSCLFTIFSLEMADKNSDVTRIASSVVAGIGFLGAGVILKDGVNIRGLTTAASIWLVASLGMGAGLGMYALVLSVTVLALVVLFTLPPFERWLDRLHDFSEFHITIKNTDAAEEKILDILEKFEIQVAEVRRTKLVKDERILHIKANMDVQQHEELGAALVESSAVLAVHD